MELNGFHMKPGLQQIPAPLERSILELCLRDTQTLTLLAMELPILSNLSWTAQSILEKHGPCATFRVRGNAQDAPRCLMSLSELADPLHSSEPDGSKRSLSAILGQLPRQDCFLLIDHAHLLSWENDLSQLLQRLLRHCGTYLRVLLLSHAPIPFLKEADALPHSMGLVTPNQLILDWPAADQLLLSAYPSLLERDRRQIFELSGGWVTAMDLAAPALREQSDAPCDLSRLRDILTTKLRDFFRQYTSALWSDETMTCMQALCVEKTLPEALALRLNGGSIEPLRQLAQQHFLVCFEQAAEPMYHLNPILQAWLYQRAQRNVDRSFLPEQHRIVAQFGQEHNIWHLVFYHQLRRGYVEDAALTLRYLSFSEVDSALLDEYRRLLRALPPTSIARMPWVQLGYAISMKYRHPNIAFRYLDRAIELFRLEHDWEGVILACCQKISMGFFAPDQKETPAEFLHILSEEDFSDGALSPVLDGYRKVFTAYATIQLDADYSRAIELLEQAQETALFQEDHNLHLWVSYVMILTYRDCQHTNSLWSILDEALQLADRPDIQKPLKMCFYQTIASVYLESGHYQETCICCEQASRIAVEINASGYRIYINMIHAYALDCLGRFQWAEQIILETAKVSSNLLNIRNQHLWAYYSIGQSYHYFLKDEWDLAREHGEKAIAYASGSGRTSYLIRALLVMGNLLAEQGHLSKAQQLARQCIALSQKQKYEFYRLSALFLQAQVLYKQSQQTEFEHCVQELIQRSKAANIYHFNFAKPETIYTLFQNYPAGEQDKNYLSRLWACNKPDDKHISNTIAPAAAIRTPLLVCILGPITVLLDGSPLEACPSTKAQSLLCILALNRQPVSVHKLLAAIWGERDEKSAMNNFYFTLHQLRTYLKRKNAILYKRGLCSLNPDEITVDTALFEQFVTTAREYLSAGNSATAKHYFSQAAQLDRGPVLSGEDLLEDALFQLEALEHAVSTALRDYGETCLMCHQPDLAEEVLSQAVQKPFADESTSRTYIKAKYLSGNKSGALAQYERLCQQLRTEFDAEPHRLTRELADRIRHNQDISSLSEL